MSIHDVHQTSASLFSLLLSCGRIATVKCICQRGSYNTPEGKSTDNEELIRRRNEGGRRHWCRVRDSIIKDCKSRGQRVRVQEKGYVGMQRGGWNGSERDLQWDLEVVFWVLNWKHFNFLIRDGSRDWDCFLIISDWLDCPTKCSVGCTFLLELIVEFSWALYGRVRGNRCQRKTQRQKHLEKDRKS